MRSCCIYGDDEVYTVQVKWVNKFSKEIKLIKPHICFSVLFNGTTLPINLRSGVVYSKLQFKFKGGPYTSQIFNIATPTDITLLSLFAQLNFVNLEIKYCF